MSEPRPHPSRRAAIAARVGVILEAICFVALWLIVLLLVLGAVERNLFSSSRFSYADEINGYLMAALVMLGATVALVDNAHVRIDIFSRSYPARWRRPVDIVFRLAGIASALIITWGGYALAQHSAATGRINYGVIEMPLWIPQAMIAVGGAIFALAFLLVPNSPTDSGDPTDAL